MSNIIPLVQPRFDSVEAVPFMLTETVQRARFYMTVPTGGVQPEGAPVARLLGNRVLLLRILRGDGGMQRSDVGLYMPDTYQKGYNTFKVLAVGPGRLEKRREKMVWVQPEVEPGDFCISNHWAGASEHPEWHQPVWLDAYDGSGRVILDARFINSVWREQ